MNKNALIDILKKYLQGLEIADGFIEDVYELLKNISGHEKEFFNLLTKQLYFVSILGRKVINVGSNERLKYVDDFFCVSLHLKGKCFNIRLLVSFTENPPLFLTAFYEREGKSKTDYTKPIAVARARRTTFMEERKWIRRIPGI